MAREWQQTGAAEAEAAQDRRPLMDSVSKAVRSRMMAGIGARNTVPELTVRRFLYAAGFRYRLHAGELPGKPDIVLRRHRTAIFVHGCFWHRHLGCRNAVLPKSNRSFWIRKLSENRRRDRAAVAALQAEGWRVVVIWECAVRRGAGARVLRNLVKWLLGNRRFIELAALPGD